MTYVKYIWSEKEKQPEKLISKPLLPSDLRIKKAEANFQRRINKYHVITR